MHPTKMQMSAVVFQEMQFLIFVSVSTKKFFLTMEYLGRPVGMSNKPHSKIPLNTAGFYLRGETWGGGRSICSGILATLGM